MEGSEEGKFENRRRMGDYDFMVIVGCWQREREKEILGEGRERGILG